MTKLPHEVKEACVIGFPALKFEVAMKYDPFEGRYTLLLVPEECGDYDIINGALSETIGSFPEDVAHILLDPLTIF